MALHRQILAAERPPRYLIAVLPHYGLADQLVGIITLFYWAFLTGRAFQISTGGQPLPPLEAAFDAPFVNWTRPAGDPPVLTEHLHLKYKGEMRYPAMHPAVPNLSEYGSMRLINGFYDFLSTENLSTIPEVEDNKSVLFMTSNRGCTQRIFNNPHYSQKLYDVGLRPETAFACAFRFLFAPSQVTRSAPGWQLAKSRLHPPPNANDSMTEGQDPSSKPENVLRIGIQIRVGDRVYRSHTDDVQFEDYMPYFDCARTIERHKRTSETTKVVWYLVSDSQRLKEKALERFGPDLLVTSTQPNTHVAHTQPKDLEEADKIMTGLGSAAADMLGLAESDYFVVTQNSGFGRIGALLSGRWNHIWSLSSESNERLMCRPADYVRLEDMASTWSGV
ncbi:hypothetical protein NSK_007463 [Nannochloropsis salina CCMP1776]|uniref:Uncharacterized protein n=1 Tax=Nannochloropsis salina CCMP1776 TaxID=1027361 RepID=A0A4D9CUJ0_9STRA|nr:hypothetical protein NSK_007463 [Nannochloropsis salina CCMP1776]|eukprot:TFJ81195.1 hypothetical protein NSK_007463 [Nannochloropsis salina CCMP1776]